jgi:dihydrofolate reductase
MGRIVMQMMMTLDGMVAGPNGELDWMAEDSAMERNHLDRLNEAELILLGSGVAEGMAEYWQAAEKGEKGKPIYRDIGRGMNETRKIIYSHKERTIDWRNAEVHAVPTDRDLIDDVERARRETGGLIVIYGGVRLARTFLKQKLIDELHLDICPIALGEGQALFTQPADRTRFRLMETGAYETGTTMLHYEVVRGA